jgi:hypothetical protein
MSHPPAEPRARRFGLAHVTLWFFFGLPAFALLTGASPGAAFAEDVRTVNRLTEMNKKALEAYAVSDFNKARQILKQALDICKTSGLEKHAIAARTHIHMGVVLVGGLNQRDLAVRQFQKALEIQPDIQVTRNVATPEVVSAFKEALALLESGGVSRTSAAGAGEGDEGDGGREASSGGSRGAAAGVIHTPITKGKKGQAILVMARLGSSVSAADKVVLSWKGADDEVFATKEMARSGNKYAAQIPAGATKGKSVVYFIEAQDSEGTVLASAGGESKPIAVALGVGEGGGGKKCGTEDEDCEEDAGGVSGPPLFVALMGGWGAGYTTGNADRTSSLKVSPGFAPAAVAHIAPEVGYFLKPDLRLSLQVRFQIVAGPNEMMTTDGMNKPAPSVGIAALARAAWFFGGDKLHPYASAALGGGQIRHVVVFSSAQKMCGKSGQTTCIDTVTAGPIFVGGGGGATYDLTDKLALVIDLNALVGFTKFTFHFDIDGGLALRI